MNNPNPPAPDQSRHNIGSRREDRGNYNMDGSVSTMVWWRRRHRKRIGEKTRATWLANNAKQEIRE
jgi:hypothetical protein